MSTLQLLQDNLVWFYCIIGLVGLLVGSFLNVVIYRLPVMMESQWRQSCHELLCSEADQSAIATDKFNLAVPASRCPSCNSAIKAWQNIPVLSYLLLLGKCPNCKTRISFRYPIIELMSATLSVVVAWRFGPSIACLAGLVITWSLISLTMIDYDHQLLPDSITLPLMWLGLLASLVPVFVNNVDAILGAAAGYISLWLVYQMFKLATGKEGMGFGDFKLLAALGAWFGWQSLPMIILLSSAVGAAIGLLLIYLSKQDKNVPIPFGPFLASAGWLTMIFEAQIQHLNPFF